MTTEAPHGDGGGFAALGLDPRLVEGLESLGYEEPTTIQQETIPRLLEGRDLVGQAATGTGKTAAFALPLLQRFTTRRGKKRGVPFALVLVPTRELAMQVAEATHRYGRALQVSVLAIYGGQSYQPQLRALERGVDVVVATPGRALDHLRRGTLSLGGIEVLVLDEADEMLDMGFAEDLDAILDQAPKERQTVLFSATLPARITGISRRYLHDPLQIRIAGERPAAGTAPKVRQTAFVVARAYKIAALARILDMESPEAAIVFCRTRNEVDELGERLGAHGYRAEVLHGGMSQEQRDRVMKKLRAKAADLVIATDVAARGLDIPQLTHVINFDVPSAPEAYVHRIGRVGRAGREGVALTLAEPREHRLMRNIEQLTKRRIDVAPVPSVADLRARRLDGVREALQETLAEGDLEGFRSVVESLGDFEPALVAMAAVKLLLESSGPESDEVIPAFAGGAFGERHGEPRPSRGAPPRGGARAPRGEEPGSDRAKPGMARLFIGGGREMGIRPQAIVGAITGEAGIRGSDVGVITISERFSLVEIPEDLAKMVVGALRGRPVKGRKVTVRLEHAAGEGFSRPRQPAWGRQARRGDDPPSRKPPGRGRPPR